MPQGSCECPSLQLLMLLRNLLREAPPAPSWDEAERLSGDSK